MRKFFISIVSFAFAAAAVMSCTQELVVNDTPEEQIPEVQGVTINAIAGEDATKTYVIDGAVPTIQWIPIDRVRVFEVVDGSIVGNAESENAVINNWKATFSTTLGWADVGGSAYSYSAVYPAVAFENNFNGTYSIIMPNNQHLSDNNFSNNSDIMFSTPVDHGSVRVADAEGVQFAFRRLGTVVRLQLKGITPGEKIRRVTLTAPVNIAGSITYNPITGTVDPATAFAKHAHKTIDLVVDDVEATGDDVVWFRVMSAADWAAGSKFDIKVITDDGVYQKNVSLPSTIEFPDGGVTKFGVGLSSSRLAPVAVPVSWEFDTPATALDGWSLIDEDGDGNNWEISNNAYAISGCYGLRSLSLDGGHSLTPDNWAYTPPVQLTTGNYLSFAVRAHDDSRMAEHYAVYIQTDSPLHEVNPSTLLSETEYPTDAGYYDLFVDGYYQHYLIPIPAQYNNQIVHIGFRHFNCTGQDALNIDNVEVLATHPEPPCSASYGDYLGVWAGGGQVITVSEHVNGSIYSISGLYGQGANFVQAQFENGRLVLNEQVVDDSDPENAIVLQGGNMLYTPDSYPISFPIIFKAAYDAVQNKLIITPGYGLTNYCMVTYDSVNNTRTDVSKSDIPAALAPNVPALAIFEEGFESDVDGTWTFIDADGDGYNWYRYDNLYKVTGNYALTSESYNNSIGALTPDNWAFTPPILLTTDNYLSFWIAGQDDTWKAEHYAVYIIDETPTGSNLGNCAVLLAEQEYPDGTPVETSGIYQRYVLQIPNTYDGQTVHIGFRHFNCSDQFMLNLDDVAVYEGNPI